MSDSSDRRGPALSQPPVSTSAAPLSPGAAVHEVAPPGAEPYVPRLGARFDPAGTEIRFRVRSRRATRIEVCLFAEPMDGEERLSRALALDPVEGPDVFALSVSVAEIRAAGIAGAVYYGYRAFGPNWPYDPAYRRGTGVGFACDVDAEGNRFNPNKLLLDPYAREVSHDPINPRHPDGAAFATGPGRREVDSGPVAPKGLVLPPEVAAVGARPMRAFRDEIIYEVHVRGLTMNDPQVPPELRGTYRGAALKAAYLQALGVTAIELLPVFEFDNERNDVAPGPRGDNYWGYMTLNYFAPDRRYAADRGPGGPTREFRQMVAAFHDHGLKVYLDVVYNHTGEGGPWSGDPDTVNLLSFRGLDNPGYYQLSDDVRYAYDNTGGDGNTNAASPLLRDLVIDSLRYWHDNLGVDGFRFDLAPVLGNRQARAGFIFDPADPDGVLARAARELPVRPPDGGCGVDLIAEPWAASDGARTYAAGRFPAGWAEWNDAYRDTLRADQNQRGVVSVTLRQLALRLSGSPDRFGPSGRRPWHSVNFLVAHDGLTLRDLYSYNDRHNGDPDTDGSDGGTDNNRCWDQGGDPAAQRQAVRTGLALLLCSAGVPMIGGGDELYRTLHGNNNPYNLDDVRGWLDWSLLRDQGWCALFARRLIQFRRAHPALRPGGYWRGLERAGGLKDAAWLLADGNEAGDGALDDAAAPFLGLRLDGAAGGDSAASIYLGYNRDSATRPVVLPPRQPGRAWYRVADTAGWMEPRGNIAPPGEEEALLGPSYEVWGRSLIILIEK